MNAPQFGCEFEIDQYIPYSLRAVSTVCGFRLVSCHVSLNLIYGDRAVGVDKRFIDTDVRKYIDSLDWNVRIKEQVAWIICRKT